MDHPTILHLFLLFLFVISSKVISIFIKRPLNGAFGYLVVGGVLGIVNIIQVFNPDIIPLDQRYYALGHIVGSLFIPVCIGLLLALRFKKKHA